MGEVYRARDTRLGRDVAVKIMPGQFAADAERLRRFEQEARAAAALNDPNIMAIYDIGTQPNGSPYIVSELLEGETLRERLRNGPLPSRKATEYAAQIARGLAAAHDKHIVHRDLKPENIFITKDGRVKILDFGLAKLIEHGIGDQQTFAPTAGGTSPGMVLGTVGYMSPEQVRGQETDHRSDIFSFGAIFYEMISGKRAFRGQTAADTMSAILKDDPPELTETNRAVSPAIERIVRHCLEKNPDERFQSARDIAFNLEALSSVSSGPMPVSMESARGVHFRRRGAFAAAGILGLVLISSLTWWLGTNSARGDFPTYKPITFRRGSIGNARFGPDGQTVIYSAAWEGAPSDIYTGRTDSLGERPMGFEKAELLGISSAGEMAIRTNTIPMGGFARRGLLSIVPTAGGAPRPIIEDIEDMDWSADGKQMALVRFVPDKDLWRLEYPAGKVLIEGSNWVSTPRISPDGKHIAFYDHGNATGDDRGAVAVVDMNGKETVLSENWASMQGLAWSPKADEVWFTASPGEIHNMYAVTLSGKVRRLASMPADVELQDVRADGKVLLKKQAWHFEIYGGEEGQTTERKLDWLDWSLLRAMSSDGKYVLFEEEGEGGGPDYTVYMRPTDGSPAVALGHGIAVAFSPDNRWVLTVTTKSPGQFVLQPTGAGEARTVTHDQIDHLGGRFLPDGKRVVFLGRESGHASRAYLLDLESGATKPITPEGVAGRALSPDGKYIVVLSKGTWMKWPVEGGDAAPIAGLKADDIVVAWTGDGQQLYLCRPDELRPRRVYLFDVASQKRTLWKSLGPQDWTGANNPSLPVVSSDGKHYAYLVNRSLADLYVVSGLK
jgi:Tol biopolymer transport system component